MRHAGHDVLSIIERSPGIADAAVLESAHREQRILITFDRDYGELVYLKSLPCPSAIILLRFDPVSPEEAGTVISEFLLNNADSIFGYFIALGRDFIRKRPLPL